MLQLLYSSDKSATPSSPWRTRELKDELKRLQKQNTVLNIVGSENDTLQHHWSINMLCNTVYSRPVKARGIPALLIGVAA